MLFDSSTLCARTAAGEAELATPSQGLSLGQRRVLTLLENPAAVEELAEKNRLEPDKLARDLTRLAELRLVRLEGLGIHSPVIDVAPPASDAAGMTPIVIGHSSRRTPVLPLVATAVAIILGGGVWYGMRTHPVPAATQPLAAAPSPAPAPAVVNPPPMAKGTIDAVPSVAVVLRGNVAAPEIRPEIRPGIPAPVAAPAKAAAKPVPTDAKAVPTKATVATQPLPALAAPVAAMGAPANPPSATKIVAPEPSAPVQLAAVQPAPVPSRPAVAAELKALSRDAPDFPKEAIADGFKAGLVNARLHIDARGNVTSVDILDSQPPKVFDRAARRALLRWQFEPLAPGQSANLDVDVKFQRD